MIKQQKIKTSAKVKELDKNKRNEIIVKAFQKACKFLREHPPYDTCESGDIKIIQCVLGGNEDPNGYRWMNYFIDLASKELIDSTLNNN